MMLAEQLPADSPVPLPATSLDWRRYFQDNAVDLCLPWNDRYRLSGAERVAVVDSIRQFQLGENAGGTRLLKRAEVFARSSGDTEYLEALRLFIGEEQRHSRILGRFLELHGIACLRRHWVHGVFRKIRALAGLELCMRVLATAEVVAVPYYTALRNATGSPLLHEICDRILQEEAAHLRFQRHTFARAAGSRRPLLRRAVWTLHRAFLEVTTIAVWWEHGKVLRAGGYSLARFRAELKSAFAELRSQAVRH
jgi:hypothetical protein